MIDAADLCAIALALWTADAPQWFAPRLPAMQATCEEIAHAADERGLDPALLVSVAWEESRFRWVESSAGAVGPLQALPHLWCEGGTELGCDLVAAGLNAWEAFAERWPEPLETACHYNGGNRCGARSLEYADRVLKRHRELLQELGPASPCGC